jgi:hypothetical protein
VPSGVSRTVAVPARVKRDTPFGIRR